MLRNFKNTMKYSMHLRSVLSKRQKQYSLILQSQHHLIQAAGIQGNKNHSHKQTTWTQHILFCLLGVHSQQNWSPKKTSHRKNQLTTWFLHKTKPSHHVTPHRGQHGATSFLQLSTCFDFFCTNQALFPQTVASPRLVWSHWAPAGRPSLWPHRGKPSAGSWARSRGPWPQCENRAEVAP